MLEYSLYYARNGYPVFPLAPGTKIPLISKENGGNGAYDGTTDEAQIKAWWNKYPNANIGISCGLRCDVLDVDSYAGGEESLMAHEPIKAVVEVSTPKGGSHIYFSPCLVPLKNKARITTGLDIRTNGGYVVCPPSRIPEGKYSFKSAPLNGQVLPEVPRWVIEACKREAPLDLTSIWSGELEDGEKHKQIVKAIFLLRQKDMPIELTREIVAHGISQIPRERLGGERPERTLQKYLREIDNCYQKFQPGDSAYNIELPERGLNLKTLDPKRFKKTEMRFLVRPYFPMGKCVLLDADGGCVAPDTLLETDGGPRRIDELCAEGRPIRVWSLAPDGNAILADAQCPFLKGREMIYEVATSDGRSIKTTGDHRFLTPLGWRFLSSLSAGDTILGVTDPFGPDRDVLDTPPPDEFGLPVVDISSQAQFTILSIREVGVSDYYDLWVPGYENYLAHGLWHHNTGKTSLMLALSAAFSNGINPLSGESIEPMKTLYLHKGEDSDEELATVFTGNGGDLSMISFYDGDLMLDDLGCKRLEEAIIDGGFDLVVIDALFYFLSELMENTNSNLPAMRVMSKLNRLAATTQATVVNIRHTKKGNVDTKASDLGMGSVQFRNSHRGQLVARWHPDKRGIVVVTDEKGSLLVPRGPSICYRRDGLIVEILHDEPDPFDKSKGLEAEDHTRPADPNEELTGRDLYAAVNAWWND